MIIRIVGEVSLVIRREQVTGISDGSFKDKRGTAACILEANKDSESRLYVLHDTPSRY